jgi:hypothetical protein
MACKSTGTVHDPPAITTEGNRGERDAKVELVRARHDRLHPVDSTGDDFTGPTELRPTAQPSSHD